MVARLRTEPSAAAVQVERENSRLSFKLPLNNPTMKINKNSATYTSADGQTEVLYELEKNKLKESIILHSPTEQFDFVSNLSMENLKIRTNADNLPIFFDANEAYQFHLEQPFAIDNAGNKTYNVTYTFRPKTTQLGKNPFTKESGRPADNLLDLKLKNIAITTNEFDMVVVVDPNWLADPVRQYPITIDPTVTHDTSAEFATGTFNRVLDTGSGSSPVLETYYQELPADERAGALWHFNETANDTCSGGEDACDSSGSGLHLTESNTTIDTSTQLLGGAARSFNGSSSYAYRSSATGFDLGADGITLETWVKTSSGSTEYILNRYGAASTSCPGNSGTSSTNALYFLIKMDTGVVRFSVRDNTDATLEDHDSNATINDGNWHHIAAVLDKSGGTVSIYIDGVLDVSSTTSETGSYTLDDSFIVGVHCPSTGILANYFNGEMDEMRVSQTVRSPEEIALAASRRPYSIFTSEVIDLTADTFSWDNFTWTELGVATGDGETVYDDTNLVAQWNFNETSGTTANNDAEGTSCGGTPANCDGTLTGFDSTASQDADSDSSWTANNRRWGAGALQFDGINSYVDAGTNTSLDVGSGDFSLEAWFRTLGTTSSVVGKGSINAGGKRYILSLSSVDCASGQIKIEIDDDTTKKFACSQTRVNDNNWHHAVGVRDGNTLRLYIDGKEEGTEDITGYGNIDSARSFIIGAIYDENLAAISQFMNGVIDSTRIYSRALSATEVLSNYNSANIELQTRVGADTSPDDGSWDAWAPITNETQILSQDTTLTEDLIAHWRLDEASGTRKDFRGTNNLTDGNTVTSAAGKVNTAADFESTNSEFLEIADNADLSTGDIDFTIATWVNLESIGAHRMIVSKTDTGTNREFALYYHEDAGSNDRFQLILYDSGGTGVCASGATSFGAPSIDTWYFVVAWHDSTANTCSIQVNNGTVDSSSESGVSSDTSANFRIGAWNTTEALFMDGLIDEVVLWKKVLTSAEKTALYNSGRPNFYPDGTDLTNFSQHGGIWSTLDESTFIEGTGSERLELGRPQVDGDTVALWHLDETSGTGAYLKDSSANANHLTPTGTTTLNGISSKARRFDGSSDTGSTTLNGMTSSTSTVTLQFWANVTSAAGTATTFLQAITNDNANRFNIHLPWSDNNIYWDFGDIGGGGRLSVAFDSSWRDQWSHWAFVSESGVGQKIYRNGVVIASDATTSTFTRGTKTLTLTGTTWKGDLDEVKLNNNAMSGEEIAEAYRMGRDHYLNKTISSTDLDSVKSLPFYVAADRPGTYLETTIGEAASANNQPDENTAGFWRFEENTNDACNGGNNDICDSSGNNNHGDETGSPPIVKGRIGKARDFDGSADYVGVTVGSGTPLDIDSNPVTMSAWVKPDNVSSRQLIVARGTVGANGYGMLIESTGNFNIGLHGGGNFSSTASLVVGRWYHVVGIINGSSSQIYINGKLDRTSSTNVIASTGNFQIGAGFNGTTQINFFNGIIDEVQVSDTAWTADEVRQLYERGLRTHPITIDFAASLDSGNLIADSNDLSFTVDATSYGLGAAGSQLFVGDKIIVREKIDDTTYIAQGTVTAVTESTGAVTVSTWDAGGTFPSGGYTANATVFKWQREYFDISNLTLDEFMDGITQLTLRVTDGHEGRTVWLDDLRSAGDYLTTPTGSAITSALGSRYFQYRSIFTSSDPFVSASLAEVSLDYSTQDPPNTPTLDEPTDTATNQILLTALKTTATDNNADYLRYKIELCTDVAMSQDCQTFDQTVSQTGWSGQDAQTGTAYASGTQAMYTIQSALDPATTYYWRSQAIDPGGTNTFGSTQGTPFSFTTTTAPDAPANPYAEGSTNPPYVIDLTPEFSAVHNDDNGDAADNYEIEVNTQSDFGGTVMWDSGKTSMTSTADGTRSPEVSYAGTALGLDGTTFYWRIRFWDTNGAVSDWSATQHFTMSDGLETATYCVIRESTDDSQLVIEWQDNATDEDGYEVRRSVNGGAYSLLQDLAAGSITHTDSTVAQGNTYQYRILPYQTGPVYGNFCETAQLSLQSGTFSFEGLLMQGLLIN
jgi:hypothetical protein